MCTVDKEHYDDVKRSLLRSVRFQYSISARKNDLLTGNFYSCNAVGAISKFPVEFLAENPQIIAY